MDSNLNLIREQGEYMEPVPLKPEESAVVEDRENTGSPE